eukprot:CAMPEP_0204826610 /NCGR_PEP_ID=MMETSP1346-20131115/4261_1 /ASSEMBLY_ACC=CAM_ASM_000771 /TAXON_ID=215587 /ORGANISM="Aplanochytrium stocchinoi, Strain GSBS06" /LENGTH=351 /DNA_ID=CAMNT_0051954705 /DNA_START=88 /DNA_END=1143 /DNA_ORIENTATION=+
MAPASTRNAVPAPEFAIIRNVETKMMDSTYFVGRKPILDWLNDFLQLNLTKIEDTANGAVACQVMDALFPRHIAMSRVDWGARSAYQYVDNYKILQAVFTKLSIDKKIPLERLLSGRDNLQFMQWLKKFFELNWREDLELYKPVIRRLKCKNVQLFKPAEGDFFSDSSKKKNQKLKKSPYKYAYRSHIKPKTESKVPVSINISRKVSKENDTASINIENEDVDVQTCNSDSNIDSLKNQNSILAKKVKDMKKNAENAQKLTEELSKELHSVETERDFYFEKLRKAEILLQSYAAELIKRGSSKSDPDFNFNSGELVKEVLKVLYASEDDVDGEAAYLALEATLHENAANTD